MIRATASARRRSTRATTAQPNTGNRVAPLPGELPDDTGGAYACYAYLNQQMHPCVYGSGGAGDRVALIGDSHASALLAVLEPQLEALNWRVTAFTGETCQWLAPALSPTCPGLRMIRRSLLRGHYAIVIATELRQYTSSVSQHLAAMRPVAATGRADRRGGGRPGRGAGRPRASTGSATARPAAAARRRRRLRGTGSSCEAAEQLPGAARGPHLPVLLPEQVPAR